MSNYLRPLLPISIYENHDLNSSIIGTLEPKVLVKYNREKRRNGVNWIEIYMKDDSKAYIQKSELYTLCTSVSVRNDSIQGFNYKWIDPKNEGQMLPFEQVVFKNSELKPGFERFKMNALSGSDEEDKEIIFEYDTSLIEVNTFKLLREQEIYQLKPYYPKAEFLIEIDNLKDQRGFILNGSKLKEQGEEVFEVLFWGIIIATVIALFVAFYQAGWIVVSGLMVLVGLGVAFVVLIAAMIVKEILRGIIKQIVKRF